MLANQDGGLSSGMFEVWTAIFDQSSGNYALTSACPISLPQFKTTNASDAGKNKDPAALSGKQTAESADIESKSRLERMLDAHMSDMNTILNGESRQYCDLQSTRIAIYISCAAGCHENYPNVKYTDPHVLKVEIAFPEYHRHAADVPVLCRPLPALRPCVKPTACKREYRDISSTP